MSLLRPKDDIEKFGGNFYATDINTQEVSLDQINLYDFSTKVLYVDPTTGSDYNDGLSQDTPFSTLEHALDVIPPVGHAVYTINLASGTYPMAEGFSMRNYVGNHPNGFESPDAQGHVIITIQGNVNNPALVIIQGNPEFDMWENKSSTVHMNLYGMTIQGCVNGINVRNGAVANLRSLIIQSFSGVAIDVSNGGECNLLADGTGIVIQSPTVSAGTVVGMQVTDGGILNNNLDGTNHSMTGGPGQGLDYGIRVSGNGSVYNGEGCAVELVVTHVTLTGAGIMVEQGGLFKSGFSLDLTSGGTPFGTGLHVKAQSVLSLSGATFQLTNFSIGVDVQGRLEQLVGDTTAWTHTGALVDVRVSTNVSAEVVAVGASNYGNVLGVTRSSILFADETTGSFKGLDGRYIRAQETGTLVGNSFTHSTFIAIPESMEVYVESSTAGAFARVFNFTYDPATLTITTPGFATGTVYITYYRDGMVATTVFS